jgi:putative transposase
MATAVNCQALRNGQCGVEARSRRSGTLWDWHKARLVDAKRYLLARYCYIKLNPVWTHMVSHPGDYLWSSYPAQAYGEAKQVVRDHELYRQLGRTVTERAVPI